MVSAAGNADKQRAADAESVTAFQRRRRINADDLAVLAKDWLDRPQLIAP